MTELRLEVGGEFGNVLRTQGSNQSACLQNYKPGDTSTEVRDVLINKRGVECSRSVNIRPLSM